MNLSGGVVGAELRIRASRVSVLLLWENPPSPAATDCSNQGVCNFAEWPDPVLDEKEA